MMSISSLVLAALTATVLMPDSCSGLYHYNRNAWSASQPKSAPAGFNQKAQLIYLHPTQTDYCGNNNIDCKRTMRSIQKMHMENGCDDIGFNFAVGGCTGIFEGSGWSGMSPFSVDDDVPTVHIGVIGKYSTGQSIPSNVQQTVVSLVNEGIQSQKIDPNAEYRCVYFDGDHSGFELQIPNRSEKVSCIKKVGNNCFNQAGYIPAQ
ncbi:peptidoglycan-recognition protein SC1a/b-like [Cloeon dipterum]|uniref:peptidoglycan-recognition protein SC1a/b-like n=1 Tax=Cloeon dipterum TaxID=197152 RepID=UPI00321F7900